MFLKNSVDDDEKNTYKCGGEKINMTTLNDLAENRNEVKEICKHRKTKLNQIKGKPKRKLCPV